MRLHADAPDSAFGIADGPAQKRANASIQIFLALVLASTGLMSIPDSAQAHTGGPGWNALPGGAGGATEPPASPEGCDAADPQISCNCDACGCDQDGPGTAGGDAGAAHGDTTCNASGEMGAHVQISNGKESFSRVDLVVNGVFPIVLERRYDSQSTFDSPVGYGWGFTLDYRIFEYADGSVVLRMGSGTRKKFNLVGPNQFDAGDSTFATLSRDATTGRYRVKYPRGHILNFHSTGLLDTIENAEGNKLVFDYDGGDPPQKFPLTGTSPFAIDPSVPMTVASHYRISTIEEVLLDSGATGRKLEFSYCGSGRLDYVQVKIGGVADTELPRVKYSHDPAGVADCVPSPDGNLYYVDIQSDASEWIRERYQYADPNDSHNVTHRQYGPNAVEYVNQYDDRDRVIVEAWGDPADQATLKMTFAYNWPASGSKSTTVSRNIYSPVTQTTTPATETYYYTDSGITTKIIDAEGGEWHYLALNAQGVFGPRETRVDRLVVYQLVDAALVVKKTVDYGYDADGRRSSQIAIDPATGHTTTETWVYDQGWLASRRTTDSSPAARVFGADYEFDREPVTNRIIGINKITELNDGANEVTTIERGLNNQVIRITPPPVVPADDFVIVQEYYDEPARLKGLLAKTYAAIDASPPAAPTPLPVLEREYQYDLRGFVSSVEDKKNNATLITRDWIGRPRSITLPNTDIVALKYSAPNFDSTDPDAAGPGHYLTRLDWTPADTSEPAQATRRIVNALGYPISIARMDVVSSVEVWEELWNFGYDSDGNLERSTIDGNSWLRRFDKRGRVLAIKDPGEVETLFAYDTLGRLEARQSGQGGLVEYAYDEADRTTLVRQTSDLNSATLETTFSYDPVGNVLTVTDPKDQTTTYQYDLRSRLETVTRPTVGGSSPVTDYDYDARGRLTKLTNARLQEIDYTYHPWGGLQTETHAYDGRAISFTYDGNGNPLTVSDSSIDTGTDPLYTFEYDALDRPRSVSAHYLGPANPQTLQHAYTIRGQQKKLSLHDGLVPSPANELLADSWSYDRRARLQAITLGGGGTIGLTHYPDDTLDTLTHAGGVTSKHHYKPYGPLESIHVMEAANELLHLSYAYDPDRMIDWVAERVGGADVEPSRPEDYDYTDDGFDRLGGALYPPLYGLPESDAYTYDDAGNRDPGTHTYDTNNQLITTPTTPLLCYDADGNLTKKLSSGDCGSGTASETFTFDTTNRLVAHTGPSGTSSYAYDPFGRRIRKTVNGATTLFQWDGDRLLAEYDGSGQMRVRYVYGEGHAPIAVGYGSPGAASLYAVHSDHLDTPRMLTDSNGSVVWRAAYEAFGEAHLAPGNTLVEAFNVRFPGQYEDAETGLHYNRFRYYDPGIGRYISADPIGQAAGPNLYTYALNNPVNWFDPFGLDVTINTRYVRGLGPLGAHSSTNITKSDGASVTFGSYEGDAGENEVRKNDPSDHGPGKDTVTSSVTVPVPAGMTSDQFDDAVIAAFESLMSAPPQRYDAYPDPGEAEGNCHTTTRGGLEAAGGGVPSGFDPPGANPDLHPSPGR